MNDEIVEEVRLINKEEQKIRERKFEIMRKLSLVSWESVQSEVISFVQEKDHVNT